MLVWFYLFWCYCVAFPEPFWILFAKPCFPKVRSIKPSSWILNVVLRVRDSASMGFRPLVVVKSLIITLTSGEAHRYARHTQPDLSKTLRKTAFSCKCATCFGSSLVVSAPSTTGQHFQLMECGERARMPQGR